MEFNSFVALSYPPRGVKLLSAFSFSFSSFFFSASAFRAFSSRDFLNIFTKITKIDVTENKMNSNLSDKHKNYKRR